MTFLELKVICDELRSLLRNTTGRDLIAPITVDEPADSEDELYFVKLVAWCYAFLFEASQPAVRHILSLLRIAAPADFAHANSTMAIANNLRTVKFHNLSLDNKRDSDKQRQVEIWVLQYGGAPPNWSLCCQSLCDQVGLAVNQLAGRWRELMANVEDAQANIENLLFAVDRDWPAHRFDRLVEQAADELGIAGLDCQKYRQNRLDEWKKLVAFFPARADAEPSIRMAIHLELERTFGNHR